jgi:hypothetical protein
MGYRGKNKENPLPAQLASRVASRTGAMTAPFAALGLPVPADPLHSCRFTRLNRLSVRTLLQRSLAAADRWISPLRRAVFDLPVTIPLNPGIHKKLVTL